MGIWLLYSKRGGGNFLVSGHVLRILCATGAGDDDEDTVRATMMEMCCQMKKASGRCRPDSSDEDLEDNGGVPCAFLR